MSQGDIDWVRNNTEVVSEFGEAVASFVGDLANGIESIGDQALEKRVRWDNQNIIEMRWSTPLGSFDSDELTKLVLLAHDRCIRVEIRPATMKAVLIRFTPRRRDTLIRFDRHPSLETHIHALREQYPQPQLKTVETRSVIEKPFDRRTNPIQGEDHGRERARIKPVPAKTRLSKQA